MNSELFEALELLEKEKGISVDYMLERVEAALISAYKRDKNGLDNVRVEINRDKQIIKMFEQKTIVETVEDPETEISLEDALKINRKYSLGGICEIELKPKNFRRLSAQTAKQVVLQKLRETERDLTLAEFEDKENEAKICTIRRVDDKNVYVEIGAGEIEAVMLPQDQVPGEEYKVNDKLMVYVKKVRTAGRNAQILVSRTSTGLVKKLFENVVPEIEAGIVEVKGISREPGQRTKIAIYSNDPNVDAVGACVGNKGSRVNEVVKELNGEKIDIIAWSEDPLEYIAKALSPAKVLKVSANEGEKAGRVVVPDDKLSLAIGKDGQNARLAARLTGWKIDVRSESRAAKEDEAAMLAETEAEANEGLIEE